MNCKVFSCLVTVFSLKNNFIKYHSSQCDTITYLTYNTYFLGNQKFSQFSLNKLTRYTMVDDKISRVKIMPKRDGCLSNVKFKRWTLFDYSYLRNEFLKNLKCIKLKHRFYTIDKIFIRKWKKKKKQYNLNRRKKK